MTCATSAREEDGEQDGDEDAGERRQEGKEEEEEEDPEVRRAPARILCLELTREGS